jgi:fatty-acyl-CoA synthase
VLTRSETLPDRREPLLETTVGGLLRDRVGRSPDVTALVGTTHAGETRRWTYAELLAAARHTSGSLLTVADPGDHIAIWAPDVAEWPIVQYAAALAGMIVVALDPALRAAELEYCLELSRATALIHADSMRDRDMADVVAHVAPRLPDLLDVISLSDVGRLYGSPVEPEELSSPEAPAMMLFTSGATGRPRGVLLAHRSLVNNARFTMHAAEVAPGAVAVAALPSSHPAGCVVSHLGPVALGGTVVLVETADPAAVLRTVADEDATVLTSEPRVLGAVLQAAHDSGEPVPRLDTVIVAGSAVPGTMIEAAGRAFGAFVHNLYGQAELSSAMCLTRRSDSREDLVTGVGRPLPHTAAKIVDPATGDVQPLGVPGEICARGYSQMLGYVDDPAATEATVDSNGWLHTGDLGSMDERGTLTLSGGSGS